ncbi:MAG: hypothetical protein AAF368_08880, partial [Planctomycetota bacterium]
NTTVFELSSSFGAWLTLASYGLGGTTTSAIHSNDSGQVLFSVRDNTMSCSLFSWTAAAGIQPLVFAGQSVVLPDGSPRIVEEFHQPLGHSRGANSLGAPMEFNHRGELATRLHFTDGSSAIVTITLPSIFEEYCFGASNNGPNCNSPCPCGNNGVVDSRSGCVNSTGRGAYLEGHGTGQIESDDLRFSMTGALPGVAALLVSGVNQLPLNGTCAPGTGLPVFDGLRCAGGNLQRHGIRITDADGNVRLADSSWGVTGDVLAGAGFVAGQTRNFQVLYRDNVAAGCLTGQNGTNGVSVTFN